jgi:hypothetical protein
MACPTDPVFIGTEHVGLQVYVSIIYLRIFCATHLCTPALNCGPGVPISTDRTIADQGNRRERLSGLDTDSS